MFPEELFKLEKSLQNVLPVSKCIYYEKTSLNIRFLRIIIERIAKKSSKHAYFVWTIRRESNEK